MIQYWKLTCTQKLEKHGTKNTPETIKEETKKSHMLRGDGKCQESIKSVL